LVEKSEKVGLTKGFTLVHYRVVDF
jgi:hypothetical protein